MTASKKLIIAIDGPAGSGKSSVGKRVAEKLGYRYVDTGAMYRAVAWKALHQGIALSDSRAIVDLTRAVRLELQRSPQQFRISVDGQDVTALIRTPEVSDASSKVSVIPDVRRKLVARQQQLGHDGGVVMEGRDIGTVVFPHADLKIFLDATSQARGERRHAQNLTEGKGSSLDHVTEAVRRRDQRDSSRSASPMVAAADAHHLDTTEMTIEQVVEQILKLADVVRLRSR